MTNPMAAPIRTPWTPRASANNTTRPKLSAISAIMLSVLRCRFIPLTILVIKPWKICFGAMLTGSQLTGCSCKKAMYRRAHATPLAGLISGRAEYTADVVAASNHWLRRSVSSEPTERLAYVGPPLRRRTSVALRKSSQKNNTLDDC